jgi:hypothetical protein
MPAHSTTSAQLITVTMALRRGLAGLVPRLLNSGSSVEALAPLASSSSSSGFTLLGGGADAGPSSSGGGFGAYQSLLRSEFEHG